MRTLLTGLRVSDPARSREFYRALGYEVVGSVSGTPLGALTMLKLPEDPFVTLELVHDAARPPSGVGGLSHLVLQTGDLLAAIAELAAYGIRAEPRHPEAAPGEPLVASVRDPDGHLVELVQWPEGHGVGMTEEDFRER